MFQPPVNNLEKIRKARKRVKQILLDIGLESCRNLLEEINSYNPGDKHYSSTSWEDVSLWEAFGRRNDYRTKPFCCSLCSFSTTFLSSFKNHLHRYHEDEKDQELMTACPGCSFASQPKTVLKHMRMFHTSVRKTVKEDPNLPRNNIKFSCLKCSFTDTLYYSMKKHVLTTHYENVVSSYFGEKTEEEMQNTPGFKTQPMDKFYCKKCNSTASSQDALIYHILTSEKHRDLEQKLRTTISEFSRLQARKVQARTVLLPKSTEAVPAPVPASVPASQGFKLVSFPQNGPTQALVGPSTTLIQNVVPTMSAVSNSPASSIQNIPATVAPTAQVGFVTASLPQNQRINLKTPLPQSVFMSRFPLNQPVGTVVLPAPQTVLGPTVLPLNQQLHAGLLPVNQSRVIACPQPIQPHVVNMNQARMFPVNQSLRPEHLPANQPGVRQNTFLSAPIFRQLIPTGKQVNGIPTYTLAPVSVSLPVTPCSVPVANPMKMPVQFSQPDSVVQVSHSTASAPSPLVLPLTQNILQQACNITLAANPLDKEAKQWKTCPVCNELFPSNVYQVHMQIAHIKGEVTLSKSTDSTTCNEPTEPISLAAHASSLRVLKEKSIRCVSCKIFAPEEDVLKHLLMHGMVCLYCRSVFHELRNFVYHMRIMHLTQKKVHMEFIKKGFQLESDASGNVLFPNFDFNFKLSKDEIGNREINLAVITGFSSQTASTIYIKIQHKATVPNVVVLKQASKCPFCNCNLSETEVYETHLKDRHHIMPTVHTILKTPAFKCIHCCGVYTGSMTLSAIDVHLLRCRNAPKDMRSGSEVLTENDEAKEQLPNTWGMHDYAKPQLPGSASDIQAAGDEMGRSQQTVTYALDNELVSVPYKRRKVEGKPDTSEPPVGQHSHPILALVPQQSITSHENKKEFLTEYFHKRPYPSRKEVELLSSMLDMWKIDVASYFGKRRHLCLRYIKNHKQCVLLGFQMSELKNLVHNLDLQEDC
ncbi:hypothetical protein FKM82_006338 [Ascaphus truei]